MRQVRDRPAVALAVAEGRRDESAAPRELDRTIDLAVEAIDGQAVNVSDRGDGDTGPILTARELTVLELLSEGRTNREIAASLNISPSTAGVHVSNILRKLGAKRRVDAAGLAHAMGLLSTS